MRKLLVAAAVVALMGAPAAYAQVTPTIPGAPGDAVGLAIDGVGSCVAVGDPAGPAGHICCDGDDVALEAADPLDGWIQCGNDFEDGSLCCANDFGGCGDDCEEYDEVTGECVKPNPVECDADILASQLGGGDLPAPPADLPAPPADLPLP